MTQLHDHTVVVGGSIAGLLAARVLADHAACVTILERDRLLAEPAFRPGVSQGRHLHLLLARGLDVLERLFPGFAAELIAAGAQTLRTPPDILWLSAGGWCRRFPPRVPLLSCSRELLEWRLRQRVAALPNVRIQDGSEVLGLLPGRHGSVAGVRWRARGRGEPRQEAALHAEFVVDASGRTSRAPSWLADLGHPPPPETIVDAFLGYASRVYSRPPGFRADWQGLYLQAKPPAHPRTGALLPIEGDRWLVGLVGAGRDYPPTDEAGFLAFARSLRSPVLYEAIKDAEPRSPIFGHRQTSNRRRHFERLAHWPAGFVVVGDAVCAFNPVYAQGITVTALAALALDEALRGQQRQGTELAHLALRVQHAVAHSADLAWLMATGEDLRYPTTEGPRSGFLARLMLRYADGVIRAAMEDGAANTAFLDVMHMRASPATLFRPRVVTAVLRMTGRRTTAGTYPNAPLDRAS